MIKTAMYQTKFYKKELNYEDYITAVFKILVYPIKA
jgi:hypothetical protein